MDKKSQSNCAKCEVLGATADQLHADLQKAAGLLAIGKALVDQLMPIAKDYDRVVVENASLRALLSDADLPEA